MGRPEDADESLNLRFRNGRVHLPYIFDEGISDTFTDSFCQTWSFFVKDLIGSRSAGWIIQTKLDIADPFLIFERLRGDLYKPVLAAGVFRRARGSGCREGELVGGGSGAGSDVEARRWEEEGGAVGEICGGGSEGCCGGEGVEESGAVEVARCIQLNGNMVGDGK
eukprot:s1430_g8.t1